MVRDMFNGKRTKTSKIALMVLMFPLLISSLISPVGAQQALTTVLIRAQFSTSIGGHNEPVPDVLIDYKILDSTEWFSVITNEMGQAYMGLEAGSSYEVKITMDESQEQFSLEYIDEDILMISINLNNANIVGCSFISPFPAEDSDLPVSSSSPFTLQISHIISFLLGIVLTVLYIRLK